MERLSIIIPTLNEALYLPTLLRALRNQTQPPDEIIVADAGSSDGTAALARAHGVVTVAGGKPAAGRNAGAKIATGDLLLFLDADVEPDRHFIEQMLRECRQSGYGVATCLMDTIGDNWLDRLIIEASNVCLRVIQPVSAHAPGFCILVRADIHRQIGGFDESLQLSEDHDYVRRASGCSKFGLLTRVRLPVSLRRLEKEGLGALMLKYLWCELNILLKRPIHSLPFEYEFGAHRPRRTIAKLGRRVVVIVRRVRAFANLD
jgi:glycosyltransferase involved in cell wall biosynthesis